MKNVFTGSRKKLKERSPQKEVRGCSWYRNEGKVALMV